MGRNPGLFRVPTGWTGSDKAEEGKGSCKHLGSPGNGRGAGGQKTSPTPPPPVEPTIRTWQGTGQGSYWRVMTTGCPWALSVALGPG